MFTPPTSILVYVNTATDRPQNAVEHGAYLARRYNAKLTLVDAVPSSPWYLVDVPAAMVDLERVCAKSAEEHLERYAEVARAQGIEPAIKVFHGSEWHEILRELETGGHDFFIKTRMPEDASSLGAIGSIGIRLMRKSSKPVFIVDPEDPPTFDHIAVSVDPAMGDAEQAALSHKVLATAIDFSRDTGARLSVVHAWHAPGESHFAARLPIDQYEMYAGKIREVAKEHFDSFISSHRDYLTDDQIHLIPGDPIDVVPAFVEREQCDLLAIGTIGRSGLAGMLMGNTSESILRRVHCSVLALKPNGFTCPLTFD